MRYWLVVCLMAGAARLAAQDVYGRTAADSARLANSTCDHMDSVMGGCHWQQPVASPGLVPQHDTVPSTTASVNRPTQRSASLERKKHADDPPQQPEVLIEETTTDIVVSKIVDRLPVNKFQLISSSDTRVVLEKGAGFLADLLAGSRYDSHTIYRVTLNMIRAGHDVRVLASAALVTNPGSAFERLTPLNNKRQRRDLQASLETIQSLAAHQAMPPGTPPQAATPAQLSEKEGLERDLADVQRLRRLARPGSDDEAYYGRREDQIRAKLSELQAAPANKP